ncbi:MAG: FHA domain-containing protein [Coriobacteriales bacterium]
MLLLIGRILLVALLYLFLFAVMRTGIGLVKGQGNKTARVWTLVVEKGPKALRGLKVGVMGPIIVGRAPGADILVPDDVVSRRHARFSLMGGDLMVEDLGSANGTRVNGEPVTQVQRCVEGDLVRIGSVEIKVTRK